MTLATSISMPSLRSRSDTLWLTEPLGAINHRELARRQLFDSFVNLFRVPIDGTGDAPGIGVGIHLTVDVQQGYGIPVRQVFIQHVAIDGGCYLRSPVIGLYDQN
jgi:hypothetical protein